MLPPVLKDSMHNSGLRGVSRGRTVRGVPRPSASALAMKIMKESIRATLREQRKSLIVGSLAYLLTASLAAIGTALPSGWLSTLPSKPILLLLALSILLNILVTCWIYLLLREDKLTLRDAVYWDKAHQPHCPACKSPISFRGLNDDNTTSYFCVQCKSFVKATGLHPVDGK